MRKLWKKHNRDRAIAFDILNEYSVKNDTNFENLSDKHFDELVCRVTSYFIRVYNSHHYTSETDYDDFAELIDNFMK